MNKIRRASVAEMEKRVVEVKNNDKDKMYINGANNLYPNETELVINNSPTAFRCANLMARYIEGKGLSNELGELIPYNAQKVMNHLKNYRESDIISLASKSLSYQNGVFFHLIYGINDEGKPFPKYLDVLRYSKCRVSKEDDNDYPGMIIYKDFDKKESFGNKNDDKLKFYPFNKNVDVVLAQIKRDAGIKDGDEFDLFEAIKSYRGQVFYLNLNPDQIYASSVIDSVYNDADFEYRVGFYTNTQMRVGFSGKKIFVTQGLDEEDSEEVKNEIAEWMGAGEASNVFHIDVEQAENLDNVLKVHEIKAQFDADVYEKSCERSKNLIAGAFNNVPLEFISLGRNDLFGGGAEKYNELKIFYSEQTEYEREQLERAFYYMGFPIKIKPIATKETTNAM